uniref:SET domain-containing protein n=1 Tax=Amphimedon queenslandica TaxID=400682 RepID=A0A1X7SZR4_AMPQE
MKSHSAKSYVTVLEKREVGVSGIIGTKASLRRALPNGETRKVSSYRFQDNVAIVSDKTIAKGEQLTRDYGFQSKDLPWLKTYSSIARARIDQLPLESTPEKL